MSKINEYVQNFKKKYNVYDLELFLIGGMSLFSGMLAFLTCFVIGIYYILNLGGSQGLTIVTFLALFGFIVPLSLIPFAFALVVSILNFFILILIVYLSKWFFSFINKRKEKI